MSNGSELALRTFSNTWSKFINYWEMGARDNLAQMMLEKII